MAQKYICFKGNDDNEEIITFPETINHDVMADGMIGLKNQTRGDWERIYRYPVSVGFVNAEGKCYGESETLGIESRGDIDTLLLKKQL